MQLTRPKKQRKEGSFITLCERFTNPLAENVGFEPRLSIPNATCYHYTTFSISGGALLWQLPHLPRCLCPVTDDTGYLYSLTRGVPTATPFHGCTSTVAHLSRPIGVFATFATVTISHLSCPYTSWPGWALVESNHPVTIFTLGE